MPGRVHVRAPSSRKNWQHLVLLGLTGGVAATLGVAFVMPPAVQEVAAPETSFPVAGLPTTAETIDAETLQAELKKLADSMPRVYPQDSAAYHFSAQIYAELKQYERAEELWRKSLALEPRHSGPRIGLANALMQKGEHEAAIELLQDFPQSEARTPELLLTLGEAYENSGDLTLAEEQLTRCTKDFPYIGQAWIALGRVQNQMGEFTRAESNLREGIRLSGPSEANLFLLTNSLVRQRKTAEARALREEFPNPPKSAEMTSDFQDQYDEALSSVAAQLFVSAASLEEEHGNLVGAADYCMRGLSLDPLLLQGYMTLASIYRRAKRFDDVLIIQQKLLELQPENLLNYLNLANIALQLGRVELAESTLERAIELERDGIVALSALVRLYVADGRLAEAHALATEVIARSPSVDSYQLLADVYAAAGDTHASAVARQKAIELSVNATDAERSQL